MKEEYNNTYGKRRDQNITTESTHLFFSNGDSNYLITIRKEETCGEYYHDITREWTGYLDIDIEVFFSDSAHNKFDFDCIEDCYGSPTFYEQNRVLFNSKLYDDTENKINQINVIIDKKNITLIDIDYHKGTIKKNYNELFSAHLKFSPTNYFFQIMNFGYFANNQDIIRTIYLLIVRFANIENSSMYLPKEIWEEYILKMIVW